MAGNGSSWRTSSCFGAGETWVQGLGFRVLGLGFRVLGFGFRVLGFGFRVLGLGFSVRIHIAGFRVRGGTGVQQLPSRIWN